MGPFLFLFRRSSSLSVMRRTRPYTSLACCAFSLSRRQSLGTLRSSLSLLILFFEYFSELLERLETRERPRPLFEPSSFFFHFEKITDSSSSRTAMPAAFPFVHHASVSMFLFPTLSYCIGLGVFLLFQFFTISHDHSHCCNGR